MPLHVLQAADGLECSPTSAQPKRDLASLTEGCGCAVQWGSSRARTKWEVKFNFEILDNFQFGIGFGLLLDTRNEISICKNACIAVCDVFDGEINILGQKEENYLGPEYQWSAVGREHRLMVSFDAAEGSIRFDILTPLSTPSHVYVQDARLKKVELFPTVIFSDVSQAVRIIMVEDETPLPKCERLQLTNFSKLLGSDVPHGVVTFRVEDQDITADRFLLAVRSQYFAAMLGSGLAESDAKVISIPSSSRVAFCSVLQFIYAGGTEGEAIFEGKEQLDVLELLHLSMEYMLDDLTRLCEWKLIQSMTIARALDSFVSVMRVKEKVPGLFAACLGTLEGNMAVIVEAPEFSQLCKNEEAIRTLLLYTTGHEHGNKRRKLGVKDA